LRSGEFRPDASFEFCVLANKHLLPIFAYPQKAFLAIKLNRKFHLFQLLLKLGCYSR